MLGCTVYGNDLNPESFKWMQMNLKNNQPKKSSNEYHVFNLDGREFLRTIVLPRIEIYEKEICENEEKRWCLSENKIIILMNLPDIALNFLDVIAEWLAQDHPERHQWILPIHIYCYTFSKAENREEDIRMRLKEIVPMMNNEQITCRFVRQVAPNKDMMCVQLKFFDKNYQSKDQITNDEDEDEKPAKRLKTDTSE